MITKKMEDKLEELKNYINEKLSSQKQSLTCTFNTLINDLKAEITKEIKSKVSKQHEKLVSQNKMLQQQVSELAKVNIPDMVVDRAHRIGRIYKDHTSNKNCKRIVRFTTLRHRTMLYRARSKLKGVKVRLDLTKSPYDLLNNANNHVKEIPTIRICYVDVNCRLKVKFTGEDQDDVFFSSMDELRDITDMEI